MHRISNKFREVMWLIFHKLVCNFSSSLARKVEVKLLGLCILAKLFLEPSRGFEQKNQKHSVHLATEKSQKSKLQMLT